MEHPKTIREQAVRDAKSSLILDASRKVFSDKGFHEARLEDIATEAGFSKASLYNYFSDKEQIFLSLVVRDFEELLSKLRNGISASGTLLASIEFFFRTVLNFFSEHIAFFKAVCSFDNTNCNFGIERLHHEHHQELVQCFENNYKSLLETFSNVLKVARERGEIKSTVNELMLSRFITALVQSTVVSWKISGKTDNIEKTVSELMEFTLHGLGCNNAAQCT